MGFLVLIGVVLILGLMFGLLFYRLSSRELLEQVNELKRLNYIMLEGMEQQGWIKVYRDENAGEPANGYIIGWDNLLETQERKPAEPQIQ